MNKTFDLDMIWKTGLDLDRLVLKTFFAERVLWVWNYWLEIALGNFRKKPNDKLTYANGADHDEVSDVNMTNRVGGL